MVLDGIITHFRELDLFIHAKYVSNFQFCFIVSCQWFFFSSLYFLSFLKVPSRNIFSCNFFFLQSKFHFLYKTANTQCIAVFFSFNNKIAFCGLQVSLHGVLLHYISYKSNTCIAPFFFFFKFLFLLFFFNKLQKLLLYFYLPPNLASKLLLNQCQLQTIPKCQIDLFVNIFH